MARPECDTPLVGTAYELDIGTLVTE